MRHSRSARFDTALRSLDAGRAPRRWTDVADDPNDAAALGWRAEVLRAAWRPAIPDRVTFLEERCRGRRVLDVGCVAHDVARMRSDAWLHGRLAAVASSCLGVDVLPDGVQAMRDRGYDALVHDLGTGLGPVASHGPFDVVVAGELIEHVESIGMLFDVARQALAPGGELVLTTPNPYAPHRVRAAQLGIVWENVDHIVYAFPSGIAELAERHGLELAQAMTTQRARQTSWVGKAKAVRARLRGQQWTTVGFATLGQRRVQRVGYGPAGGLFHGLTWPGRQFTGETFVYVIRAPHTG
jgi:2-polyprenyl-3-methyl-5-hydroxy-6-metoxy-1,4-benzoquinol methylase